MSLEIEEGIPMPTKYMDREKLPEIPWGKLETGQSVFIPCEDKEHQTKRLSALRQACYRQEQNFPKFFKVARATKDDNTVGCRLFCVGIDDAEDYENNQQI
jgi:hypothetical protein|tara:strand:- start:717 stop:1019 length:303 start_codon:yes stop_codon:yes gene_type:complete